MCFVSDLVDLGVLHSLSGEVLCDVGTENEEDDLQWPHGCLPLGTLSKTVHQVKQLLCTVWERPGQGTTQSMSHSLGKTRPSNNKVN